MTRSPHLFRQLVQLSYLLLTLLGDVVRFLRLCLRSPAALAAENLFLRKQLALYQERHITPGRATNATRLALIWLGRWFDATATAATENIALVVAAAVMGTVLSLERISTRGVLAPIVTHLIWSTLMLLALPR